MSAAAAADERDVLEKVLQIVLKHLDGAAVETGKVAALVADLSRLVAQAPAVTVAAPPPPAPQPPPEPAPSRWPMRLGPPIPGLRQDEPAVPIDQSVFPNYIICLEDGRPFKMMRRWLGTEYGLTPAQYRKRWGLRADSPMIAPDLRRSKAAIATEQGFGQVRRKAKKPATRGRKPKA